jgi:hypothetical protein
MDRTKSNIIEGRAIEAAKRKFRKDGFIVKEKGPHHGCDFTATQNGSTYLVEVKGRTRNWPFIQFSGKENDQLKSDPKYIVALVLFDKRTGKSKPVKILRKKDFTKRQTASVRWFLRSDIIKHTGPISAGLNEI